MSTESYPLSVFLDDLRQASTETTDEKAIISRVAPLAKRLALDKSWVRDSFYQADAKQGFGVHLLHEEPEHALAVFAVSWLPGRGAPPHNHGTWAVVAGVDGPEKNTFWERTDDGSRTGYAELKQVGEKVCDVGDVVPMVPADIHAVINETHRVTLSLHVYGKHINYTGRSQFDPEKKTETPFILKVD